MSSSAVSAGVFDLRRFLPTRLTILSNRLARRAAKLYGQRFNLSAAEWRVMAVLGHQGAMAGNAVIAQTTMDKVRVSRAVATLLKSDLITRDSDPQDRRRAILGLTASGRALFQQILPLIEQTETEMMAALSDAERNLLSDALAKIEGYLARTRVDADDENEDA